MHNLPEGSTWSLPPVLYVIIVYQILKTQKGTLVCALCGYDSQLQQY